MRATKRITTKRIRKVPPTPTPTPIPMFLLVLSIRGPREGEVGGLITRVVVASVVEVVVAGTLRK